MEKMLRTDREEHSMDVHLFTDRRMRISRWSKANDKLADSDAVGFYSYDRMAGLRWAGEDGTCPAATQECLSWCYAVRGLNPNPLMRAIFQQNVGADIPPLPKNARIIRWHVSGDFDSSTYVNNWIVTVKRNRHVKFFGYTRSWRLPSMLPSLIALRDLPNVQLFASVDNDHSPDEKSHLADTGWRLSWVEGDREHDLLQEVNPGHSLVCPEETGAIPNCDACGFCIDDRGRDVYFLKH